MMMGPNFFAPVAGNGGGGGSFGPHRYWRTSGFAPAGGLGSADLELAEWRFLFQSLDLMTFTYACPVAPFFGVLGDLFDGPGGTSTNYGNRPIWNASDAMAGTFYVSCDFKSPRSITGIKMAGHDTPGRYPSGVTLQYSDDDATWTTQGSASGLAYP